MSQKKAEKGAAWLDAEIEKLLPETGKWPAEGNVMADFLAHLARGNFEFRGSGDAKALNRVCRKVDVVKKVWATYDGEWEKRRDKTPLPIGAWPMLIMVLLRFSDQVAGPSTDQKGEALKFINCAFNALDLYGGAGGSVLLEDLRQLAQGRLMGVLRP